MNREALLGLALAAIDDADARVVLADAIEESGWWDTRLGEWIWETRSVWEGSTTRYRHWHLRDPDGGVCRAIAAVLLFGDFQETPWR